MPLRKLEAIRREVIFREVFKTRDLEQEERFLDDIALLTPLCKIFSPDIYAHLNDLAAAISKIEWSDDSEESPPQTGGVTTMRKERI